MIEHRSHPRLFIHSATFLAVYITAFLVYYARLQFWDVAIRAGLIALIPSALWWAFDRYAWRWPIVRLNGLVISLPDLNGRWEGTVDRDGEDNPHAFVMEVRQSYSLIRTKTFSRNSRGESIVAKMVRATEGGEYKLFVIWQTTTSHAERRETFYGCSSFEVGKPNKKSLTLSDRYFTDRTIQTRGRVELKLVSRERRNSFE